MEIIVEGQAYIGCSLSQVFKQLHFCLCTNCVDQIPCETMSRSTHASAHQCLMFSCTWETVHSDRPLYGRSELEICRFGVLCSGTGCLALIFAMPLLSVSLQEPVSPALKLVRAEPSLQVTSCDSHSRSLLWFPCAVSAAGSRKFNES